MQFIFLQTSVDTFGAHAASFDLNAMQVNVENVLDTNYYPDAHSNDNIPKDKRHNARFAALSRF